MPGVRAGSPQPCLSTSGCFSDPEAHGCITPGSVTALAGSQILIFPEGTSAFNQVGMVGFVEVVSEQSSARALWRERFACVEEQEAAQPEAPAAAAAEDKVHRMAGTAVIRQGWDNEILVETPNPSPRRSN